MIDTNADTVTLAHNGGVAHCPIAASKAYLSYCQVTARQQKGRHNNGRSSKRSSYVDSRSSDIRQNLGSFVVQVLLVDAFCTSSIQLLQD